MDEPTPKQKRKGMVQIGGLWSCTTAGGEVYLKGGFGYGANVLIFQNRKRESERDPSHTVFVASKNARGEYGRQ